MQKIKQAKVNYLDISIDGASAKTHDEFRGVPGTFDKAVAGLKNCVEADLCVCIATTVGKNNMAELPAIIDLAEEIGAERFTYFNFIPTGRGKAHYDQDLSPEEREKVMRYLLATNVEGLQNNHSHHCASACPCGIAMSRTSGHRRSNHVHGAHANRQSNQKSRSAWRFHRRMRSRKTLLFIFSSRRCSPLRVFARERRQPQNRKVPRHLAKRAPLQCFPKQRQPQRFLRKMRLTSTSAAAAGHVQQLTITVTCSTADPGCIMGKQVKGAKNA